jgi:hypothetical protein
MAFPDGGLALIESVVAAGSLRLPHGETSDRGRDPGAGGILSR